jgi:hypothetical protein
MFTEETVGRDDVREQSPSTIDADFAAHTKAIEELYQTILTGIAEAARAWTPEAALREATPTEAARIEVPAAPGAPTVPAPRTEPRTEAITLPRTETIVAQPQATGVRTDVIAAQQAEAPVRTRGAHHAETGQLAAVPAQPDGRRGVAA